MVPGAGPLSSMPARMPGPVGGGAYSPYLSPMNRALSQPAMGEGMEPPTSLPAASAVNYGSFALPTLRGKEPKRYTGFAFSVVCTLKQPITAPTYGTPAQALPGGQTGMPGGGPMGAEPMAGPAGAPGGAPPAGEGTGEAGAGGPAPGGQGGGGM